MTKPNIPSWLTKQEDYTPPKDKGSFAKASSKSAIGVLSRIKQNSDTYKANEANTSIRLFGMLGMIILTAVCKNFTFVLLMIAVVLVRTATLKAKQVKALVTTIFPVLCISALVLMPAIFMGNPKTPLTILGKILVCCSLALIVSLTSPFNEITTSLKLLCIPDVVIFTLDLTIKYIYQLGAICNDMLRALTLRSIGKASSDQQTMSGILGSVFLKAKQASTDTAKAMECRGFDGKYPRQRLKKFTWRDGLYLTCLAAIIGAFIYLEVIV